MHDPIPHDDHQLAASLWASAIGLYIIPQWINIQTGATSLVLAVLALQLALFLRKRTHLLLQLLQIAALVTITAIGKPVVALLAASLLWPQVQPPSSETLLQPYSLLVSAYMLLVTGLFVWGWLRARNGLAEPMPVLSGWAQRIAALMHSD